MKTLQQVKDEVISHVESIGQEMLDRTNWEYSESEYDFKNAKEAYDNHPYREQYCEERLGSIEGFKTALKMVYGDEVSDLINETLENIKATDLDELDFSSSW